MSRLLKINFIVFCLVGGASAIADVFSLFLFLRFEIFDDFFSVSASFFIGLVVNYYLHTHVTFRSKPTINNIIKFLCVVLFNYAITLFVIYVFVDYIRFDIIVAKLISLPIVSVCGYFLSKYWVYSNE